MKATIFKNISPNTPYYISIDKAILRIKEGKSKELVEKIRAESDYEKRTTLKKRLPCVCFSGTFEERYDSKLIEHSGFIVLDFDHVNIEETSKEVKEKPYVYAFWVSPSGDGLKVLVKIKDKSKHRSHFKALRNEFILHEEGVVVYEEDKKTQKSRVDKSGINESRICFESWDENIYTNENAVPFEGLVEEVLSEKGKEAEFNATSDDINKLVKWLAKDNRYFVSGERNTFIFILACACCRYGVDLEDCKQFCFYEFYQNSSDFTKSEGDKAIDSAYRTEKNSFGTVSFKKGELVNEKGEKPTFEGLKEGDKIIDVIYADDVYTDIFSVIDNGYQNLHGIGVETYDRQFKQKRGQINLLSGYGNHGKSAELKWYLVVRAILFDEKYALFVPEESDAAEFYHSMMEIIAGCSLSPQNYNKPDRGTLDRIHDFVKCHFFFVFPETLSPTPEYIKERFMYLMFTEKIDGVVIDPFNQMVNDYKSVGGRTDKYLEVVLSDFKRFATINNIFFWIVAHPRSPQKNKDGGFDAPTEYDLNDGAMWANKMDNILIYHRPHAWSDPKNPLCELYARKIKKIGINGQKGYISFEYDFMRKRFIFDGYDVLSLNKILGSPENKTGNFEKENVNKLEVLNNLSNFESEKTVKAFSSEITSDENDDLDF